MKTFAKCLAVLVISFGLAAPALAVDRDQLDRLLGKLSIRFSDLQAQPAKAIPPEYLRQAQGIILLDRTKGGFIVGYQAGAGVAMVREPGTGRWSAPTFVKSNEGSLGFQIGGQESFVVILFMTPDVARTLSAPVYNFGGEAAGTAGNTTKQKEGSVVSAPLPPVMVYSDTQGLYGGATIKGGALAPDPNANLAYYGQPLSPEDILYRHLAQPSPATTDLMEKIRQASGY